MFVANWSDAMNELGSKSTVDSILRKEETDEDDIFHSDDDEYDDLI